MHFVHGGSTGDVLSLSKCSPTFEFLVTMQPKFGIILIGSSSVFRYSLESTSFKRRIKRNQHLTIKTRPIGAKYR